MTTQWHPLFVQMLRPLVEAYFHVQTNVPVGDVPRQADLVLLQRVASAPLPFVGLWRHLTTWNILEYKGPSDSARLEHLDLLVELGLGIHRRLNEQGAKSKQKAVPAEEVSFWYLPHDIGVRFLKRATRKLGALDRLGDGIWRGCVLERPLFLVSGADLPVQTDSAPFHLLEEGTSEKRTQAARLLLQQPSLANLYVPFFTTFYPEIFKEIEPVSKTKKKGLEFHLEPLVDLIGMKKLLDKIGMRELLLEAGVKRIVAELGAKKIIDEMGAKKIIDEVGTAKIIDEVGAQNIIDEALKRLSEEERAELKRRLDQPKPKGKQL